MEGFGEKKLGEEMVSCSSFCDEDGSTHGVCLCWQYRYDTFVLGPQSKSLSDDHQCGALGTKSDTIGCTHSSAPDRSHVPVGKEIATGTGHDLRRIE